jgi:hypothetical protein
MKMSWLTYALMTVFFWGVYGVILHMGRGAMPGTPPNPTAEGAHAGLKAFLLVCVAYAVIGIIAGFVLKGRGSDFSFTSSGIFISLVAGIAGAAGALTLVLALGAASPIYKTAAAAAVMPIVFGGAPIVNSALAMLLHPPDGGLKALPIRFILGVLLAAAGGVLVAMYAPSNTGGAAAKPAAAAAPAQPKP